MIPNRTAVFRLTREETLQVLRGIRSGTGFPLLAISSAIIGWSDVPARWWLPGDVDDSPEIGAVDILCGGGPRAEMPAPTEVDSHQFWRYGTVRVALPYAASDVYVPGVVSTRTGVLETTQNGLQEYVELSQSKRLFGRVVSRLRRKEIVDVCCLGSSRRASKELSGRASRDVAAHIKASAPHDRVAYYSNGEFVEWKRGGVWSLGRFEWPHRNRMS